jgi:hypothetical protein
MHSILTLSCLIHFEHKVQSRRYTSFWCPFFKTNVAVHASDVGVWLGRVTTSGPHTKLGDGDGDEMNGGEAYWPWD